jgi:hypothetical protein
MIDICLDARRAAFEAPFNVYPSNSLYVSPMWSDLDRILDPGRNPLVTEGHGRFQLFTAHRNGRSVGRIVASIHDAVSKFSMQNSDVLERQFDAIPMSPYPQQNFRTEVRRPHVRY